MRLILTNVRGIIVTRSSTTAAPTRFLAGLLLAVIVASCGGSTSVVESASPDTNSILVTTSIWADVVDNLTCSEPGSFEPLIPPGADPHGYRPSIADAEATKRASVIIANGGGLEEPLEALIDRAESEGVTIIRLTELAKEGAGDPHLWLDPTVAIEISPLLSDQLVDAGLDRDRVVDCTDDYVATLEALDADLMDRVAHLDPEQRKLVTNHDALGRFAARYGFEVIGTVLPSTSTMAQTNPAELEALADLIAFSEVPAIFTEGGHEGEDAQALADRLDIVAVGLQTDALGPEGSGFETYVDLMRTNTELIVAALGSGESGPEKQ